MSQYNDFISDFPLRCREVMQRENARPSKREVTVSLMAASAAFLIPFERLKPSRSNERPPAHGDNKTPAAEALKDLLEARFVGSSLCPQTAASWRFCNYSQLDGEVDEWVASAIPLSPYKSTKAVLTIIRNSLAHGNIYTKGYREIESLVFVTTNEDSSYRFLEVSPVDFRRFLSQWFRFLEEYSVAQNQAYLSLTEAA